MKSGIISDSVKLFIAHFCHQVQADPVGWVITEGGPSPASTQKINSSTYTQSYRKAPAKANIAINTAVLLFDITLFSEVCYAPNFTHANSILCAAQHPCSLCGITGSCHFPECFGS